MRFSAISDSLDSVTGTTHNCQSLGGHVEVGVYRVLFGWRVQAWHRGERGSTLTINWCAGGDWEAVGWPYSLLLGALAGIEESDSCLRALPPL
jgi:hypothetical protein